jgi:hypothetical protein
MKFVFDGAIARDSLAINGMKRALNTFLFPNANLCFLTPNPNRAKGILTIFHRTFKASIAFLL